MLKKFPLFLILLFFVSCSSKKNIVYLKDSSSLDLIRVKKPFLDSKIYPGDILKIDVHSTIPEASSPYNKLVLSQINSKTIKHLQLDGYLVDEFNKINFPILGKISVDSYSVIQLEEKIQNLLVDGNHLSSPIVKISRLNSKFSVLGEVRNPGTFEFIDESINIFQALGYAGDLTIDAKRTNVTLIREINGLRKTYKIDLTSSKILNNNLYNIYNNDILIINPSFSKVKSAGFIGSPSSIASISSIILSITLLLINKN